MRTLCVCLFLCLGVAGCAERGWPPWLPAPVSDDPEVQEIMGGTEPYSPYLLQPYRPQRPWTWPGAPDRRVGAPAPRAGERFNPDRISRKLSGDTETPGEHLPHK